MKSNRQETLLRIIENEIISTQDDLQNALERFGFTVTQSTVSRDIRELKLIKGHDADGNYRYLAHKVKQSNEQTFMQYREMLNGTIVNVDSALNDVVIKTYVGMASSICVALDALYSKEMLGSIAGDDTIFIVTHSNEEAAALCEKIKRIM